MIWRGIIQQSSACDFVITTPNTVFCVVPTSPTLLSVIASDPGSLTVTWAEPASTNGEIINYNISINDGAMLIESSGMGTEFVVTGLEPYTDYSVRVQACTSEGCGPFSNEILNTTLQEGEICTYNEQQC